MNARLIRLPTIGAGVNGSLTAIEIGTLPFVPVRTFYLWALTVEAKRGGHAHHTLQEFILPLGGSFDVRTRDEFGWHTWHLLRPDTGLYIPPGVWRVLTNFSDGATVLVLASTPYDEADYIRDMDEFVDTLPATEEDYFTRRGKATSFEDFVNTR